MISWTSLIGSAYSSSPSEKTTSWRVRLSSGMRTPIPEADLGPASGHACRPRGPQGTYVLVIGAGEGVLNPPRDPSSAGSAQRVAEHADAPGAHALDDLVDGLDDADPR